MITVVADACLADVSTRRMDTRVKTLGIHSLSKSQVSRMATDLDEHVHEFRPRPLDDAGPFILVATRVNADGHREALGIQVATTETGMAW